MQGRRALLRAIVVPHQRCKLNRVTLALPCVVISWLFTAP